MPASSAALERIRAIVEQVAASEGMEVVDVELRGAGQSRVLRIFIDRPDAKITHADCELISRQVSAILDVEDLVPGKSGYVLEVSSPGMDRKLVKPEHFRRFSGNKVKVTTRQPIEGQRRNFSGRLEGIEDDRVKVQLDDGRTVEIELQQIERAHLVPEWD